MSQSSRLSYGVRGVYTKLRSVLLHYLWFQQEIDEWSPSDAKPALKDSDYFAPQPKVVPVPTDPQETLSKPKSTKDVVGNAYSTTDSGVNSSRNQCYKTCFPLIDNAADDIWLIEFTPTDLHR